MTKAGKHIISIVPGIGKSRGHIRVPEHDTELYLNPVERTLLCLFIAHPEGILANDLLLHWQELQSFYERESLYDDYRIPLCRIQKSLLFQYFPHKKEVRRRPWRQEGQGLLYQKVSEWPVSHPCNDNSIYTSITASGTKSLFSP